MHSDRADHPPSIDPGRMPRLPAGENYYRSLFEHSPDGILIVDSGGHCIDANPRMLRMLAYARDDLIGLHAATLVAQDGNSSACFPPVDRKAGHDDCREWQFRRKDGSTFSSEVAATAMPDGNLFAWVREIPAPNQQAEMSATWLAAIVESSQDAIIGKDLNSIIASWNVGAQRIFGYSADEMIGTSILRLIPADRQHEEDRILAKIRRGEKVENFETLRKTKNGRLVDVMITISPIRDATGKIIGASKIAHDITALKQHEREVERLSRLYAALSQVNQAIVWTKSRDELFRKICGVLVEYGGFRMAWIGWHDPETRLLVPVAECGDETGYLRSIKVYVDDRPEGRGPGGMAFREERPYISNDMLNDPPTLPWRKEIIRAGFRASTVFPVRLKGSVCGTLGVYSDQAGIFREQEVALLEEAAGDISFALDSLSHEEDRLRIEREIKFKNTILQTQQETSLDAILIVDENEQIISYNQQFVALWRLPSQLVSARKYAPVFKLIVDQIENPDTFVSRVDYLYRHRDERSHEEIALKDGRIIGRYSAPIVETDRKYYGRVWYFRDITESKRAKEALERSTQEQRELVGLLELERSRLVAAQRIAKVGSWETSLSTMTVIWSEETPRIFEVDPRQLRLTHQDFLELVHPADREEVNRAFAKSLEHSSPCRIEHRVLTPGGRVKFVEENWQVFFDDHGQAVKAIGTCQDISERKAADARIKYLNRVQATLSGINTLIVRVQDRDELFGGACRVAVEMGGFTMAMIVTVDPSTRQLNQVASYGKGDELMSRVKQRLATAPAASTTMVGMAINEMRPMIANDSLNDPRLVFGREYAEAGVRSLVVLPLVFSGVAAGTISLYASEPDFFHEEEMQLLTELAGDIAFAIDHIRKQEKLNFLAYYDNLTGLANRTLYLDRVTQYMRAAEGGGYKLALLVIDLERFKNINDILGWTAGNELLKQVAQWLARRGGSENLVARMGADEFAMVIPEVRSDGSLTKLLDKMSQAFLDHSFRLNDTELRMAAKAGIALYPDDGADVDILFMRAEAALKAAKKSGDRYLFHTQQMTEAMAEDMRLENRLRQAIDNDEFVLHYQPKVDLGSGKVCGAEALIRWNDPLNGLVAPGKFIPVLEQAGLISEVGRWALDRALGDYLRWRAAGLNAVRIAVNVSSLQLRNPGFVAEIESRVAIDPHAAAGIELEITESMIMDDMKRNVSSLRSIREMGLSVAIDDFGTGFSSLGYLTKLPVDTLKIDRSFVQDMTDNPEALSLVSTIITLAHSLKLKVVAEGVETEAQANLLRLLRCDEMQGYLFSKPVPREEFESRFLTR